MKRYCLIFLFFAAIGIASAQDVQEPHDSEPPNEQPPITAYAYEPIRKGDQFLRIGLQLGIPLFNSSPAKIAIKPNMYPGGSISLGYSYYLTKGLSLGGEIDLDFYVTIGENLLFLLPIIFDVGYTFTAGKMRFPLSFGIGGNYQAYNEARYFGMFFRPRAGFFYQYSPEWSFGGELSWEIIPQWYKPASNNRTGNFLGISFAVRYHF